MKLPDKPAFLTRSQSVLGEILDLLKKLPPVRLQDLPAGQTVLVLMDLLNGFTREGALKSPRVEALIPDILKLSRKCEAFQIPKLALTDCHDREAAEFAAYPPHCIQGTGEAEIVTEIQAAGGYTLIRKNSTNAFAEERFQHWLRENSRFDCFIVTGDCTDICILQFALALKAWFNNRNRTIRVIVPINAVDTYDLGTHEADLINVMSLYNLVINGIEVVKEVS